MCQYFLRYLNFPNLRHSNVLSDRQTTCVQNHETSISLARLHFRCLQLLFFIMHRANMFTNLWILRVFDSWMPCLIFKLLVPTILQPPLHLHFCSFDACKSYLPIVWYVDRHIRWLKDISYHMFSVTRAFHNWMSWLTIKLFIVRNLKPQLHLHF